MLASGFKISDVVNQHTVKIRLKRTINQRKSSTDFDVLTTGVNLPLHLSRLWNTYKPKLWEISSKFLESIFLDSAFSSIKETEEKAAFDGSIHFTDDKASLSTELSCNYAAQLLPQKGIKSLVVSFFPTSFNRNFKIQDFKQSKPIGSLTKRLEQLSDKPFLHEVDGPLPFLGDLGRSKRTHKTFLPEPAHSVHQDAFSPS